MVLWWNRKDKPKEQKNKVSINLGGAVEIESTTEPLNVVTAVAHDLAMRVSKGMMPEDVENNDARMRKVGIR